MSFFLILFLIFLMAGAGITAYTAHREHKYSNLTGAAIILGILILWVIAGRQLPLQLESKVNPAILSPPSWNLYVDEATWQLTLVTILLAAGVILAIDIRNRVFGPINESHHIKAQTTPLIFLLLAATILALWSNSLITLIQSWALFIITWSLFYGFISSDPGKWRTILTRSCALSISLIFLWLANASNSGSAGSVSDIQEWTSESSYWALMASSGFLGLILLHWWRPLESSLPAALDSIIHLLPTICGGWLFIQVSAGMGHDSTSRLIITVLSLIGLLTGATLAWANVKQPRRLPPYLTLSFVNMVALAAVWLDSEAAAAELRISLLALGGLFLFSSWSEHSSRWERIISTIFVIALAGLPLTIGFHGRVSLYQTWLEGGQLLLALVVSLILLALLGAALLIVLRRDISINGASLQNVGHLEYSARLLLLAFGLIGFNGLEQFPKSIVSLLFILIPALGGYLLSRQSVQAYELQQTVGIALHFDLPRRQITEYLSVILSNIESIIREGAAILEGEGGMLWLLIIIIILWLARIS
jgi:hypothetical protein